MNPIKLVLASRNRHKITELQALLSQHLGQVEILSLDDIGFAGDIEEDGTTFEENALIKARVAAQKGHIGLGDDSGLAVPALGGAPGIYSARYAGEHGNDRENNALLLKNMEHMNGSEEREGRFVCVIACVLPNGEEFCVRGETVGEILREYRGEGGFGYDPLFYYAPFGKTYAEMSPAEKNSISHRGNAVELLASELAKRNV